MKKKFLKIFILFSFISFIMIPFTIISANNDSWIGPASDFKPTNGIVYLDESVLSELANLVEIAGTGVIAIATVVIGVKFVLGSVEEKASAKENLITLLVACLFFFGWTNIRGLIINGITFGNAGVVTNMEENIGISFIDLSHGPAGVFNSIFKIVLGVAQMIAILATAYMGVKYVFGGAENKAKLKEKSIGYIIGIIMIFTTLNFLKFISNTINGMF